MEEFGSYDPDAILADPEAHPVHKMFASINVGIRDRGEEWMKCANCGGVYPRLTEDEFFDSTVCSPRCAKEYSAYLNDPDFW